MTWCDSLSLSTASVMCGTLYSTYVMHVRHNGGMPRDTPTLVRDRTWAVAVLTGSVQSLLGYCRKIRVESD